MTKEENFDLYRFTFSDFNTANKAVNDKRVMLNTFNNTPLIGKDASEKGLKLITTGSTYDC